jgi:hypothetical protein
MENREGICLGASNAAADGFENRRQAIEVILLIQSFYQLVDKVSTDA